MDLDSEIKTILSDCDRKITDLKKQQEQDHKKFVENYNEVYQVKEKLVLPSINKTSELLKSEGHDCKIRDDLIPEPNSYNPSIELTITPKPDGIRSISINHIKFYFDIREKSVKITQDILQCTPQSPRPQPDFKCKINELTQENVDTQLVLFLKNIF